MGKLITPLSGDRRGATAIEYGLIVCLIMVAILTAATATGTQLSTFFNGVATTFANSPAG